MTLTQVWGVLRGRWRAACTIGAAVWLLVIGASVALLYVAPRYTATAAVVLDVKSPDPIAGIVLPGMQLSSYMATQVDVLASERVALRAIDAVGLADDPDLRDDWLDETGGIGDYRAWLAERVVRNLDARPSRESNVINVKYTARSPERAAAIANAFVDAYREVTLQLRVEPARQYGEMFDGHAKELRDQLEAAQNKLSEYQRQHGILATDERLDVENTRLSELASQLVLLQTAAADSNSRNTQAGANTERMQEVINNPVVVALKSEQSRQEARLDEISARLGAKHPQVVELQASIAQLRSKIAGESQKVAGSLAVNDRARQAQVSQLRAAVDQQRAKLMALKEQRDESMVLLRDVENAQRAYDAVLTRLNQSRIESQASQTNVSLLKRATTPALPSSPNLPLNIAAGLLLALLLGAVTALVRELRDPRLRSDDDVRILKQPLIGVLPSRAIGHASGMRQRLTGPLAALPPR